MKKPVTKPKRKFVRRVRPIGGPAPLAVRREIAERSADYLEALMADFDRCSREYDAALTDRYDAACPACRRGRKHTNAEHDQALAKVRKGRK